MRPRHSSPMMRKWTQISPILAWREYGCSVYPYFRIVLCERTDAVLEAVHKNAIISPLRSSPMDHRPAFLPLHWPLYVVGGSFLMRCKCAILGFNPFLKETVSLVSQSHYRNYPLNSKVSIITGILFFP